MNAFIDPSAALAVFVDFDGTLVDLAARPDAVSVPADLGTALGRLDRRLGHALALVTGRSIAVVDGFLAPDRFAIAGAHGSERRRADGMLVPPAPALVAAAGRLYDLLRPLADGHPELVLERKDAAVALHFRQAPELEAICRAAVAAAVRAEPQFFVVAGKLVFEVRPAGIDKGSAVAAFMREPPFSGRRPVFVGDDTTDEDGFAVVQGQGGIGVKVGPGPTIARSRLAGVAAVHHLLAALASGEGLAALSRLGPTTPAEDLPTP